MSGRVSWDIVVVGGANTDYLVRGEKLPKPGETIQGDVFQEAPGGKGANGAVAAARLGARVALIARVGTDTKGDELIASLEKEGVYTQYIVRDAAGPTGVALVSVDKRGEKQILTAPGANTRLTVVDVHQAAGAISAARVLLTQLEVPLETVMAAARLAREAGVAVVLDPAPPPPAPLPSTLSELLRLVNVIKPNSSEAEALTGVQVEDRDSARHAIRQLLDRGVGAAIVEAGDEGSLLIWRDKQGEREEGDREHWLPKISVDSVDSTGAGDAFAAALAVMIAEGRLLEEAASFANVAAALATTQLGAQAGLPKREEVQALLARIEAGDWR